MLSCLVAALATLAAAARTPTSSTDSASPTPDAIGARPTALIYKGKQACQGCPESVAALLQKSSYNFVTHFAGPDQDIQLTPENFKDVSIFAYPGGANLTPAAKEMEPYNETVRNFVAGGGRFMGFCLGAYMAGDPGYGLIPYADRPTEEVYEPHAEVRNPNKNTILRVNWTFHSGQFDGQTRTEWAFFQDGDAIVARNRHYNLTNLEVLARYTKNGDIAATLSPFGDGWVATTGVHVEADRSWYTPYGITNPDGYNLSLGFDFVHTLMSAGASSPPSDGPPSYLLE